MPAYEAGQFDPPAPVLRSTVRGPRKMCLNVPMLIDTGADVSVIPLSVATVVEVTLQPSNVPIQSYDGDQMFCDEAQLSLEFLRYRFSGIFLVTESEYGILGRNILNSLVIEMDGPRSSFSVISV